MPKHPVNVYDAKNVKFIAFLMQNKHYTIYNAETLSR